MWEEFGSPLNPLQKVMKCAFFLCCFWARIMILIWEYSSCSLIFLFCVLLFLFSGSLLFCVLIVLFFLCCPHVVCDFVDLFFCFVTESLVVVSTWRASGSEAWDTCAEHRSSCFGHSLSCEELGCTKNCVVKLIGVFGCFFLFPWKVFCSACRPTWSVSFLLLCKESVQIVLAADEFLCPIARNETRNRPANKGIFACFLKEKRNLVEKERKKQENCMKKAILLSLGQEDNRLVAR